MRAMAIAIGRHSSRFDDVNTVNGTSRCEFTVIRLNAAVSEIDADIG